MVVVLGHQANYSFNIILNDNSFTRKWVKELAWNLDNNQLDQHHTFAFLLSHQQKMKQLRLAVSKVNNFIRREFITLPDVIDENDTDFFNHLHECFEKLAGSTEVPSKLFYIAPDEIKIAIRNINCYCHALESPAYTEFHLPIQFNPSKRRRFPLEQTDYDFFENRCIGGKVYLTYTEVGKNFRDLCKDNLPVDYIAAKNTHFYTGDFHLNLMPFVDTIEEQRFQNWCVNNNVNYDDKTLGIGFIELGSIIQSVDEIKQKLQQYSFIQNIIIDID